MSCIFTYRIPCSPFSPCVYLDYVFLDDSFIIRTAAVNLLTHAFILTAVMFPQSEICAQFQNTDNLHLIWNNVILFSELS